MQSLHRGAKLSPCSNKAFLVNAFLVVLLVIITVLALAGWYRSDEIKRAALMRKENPEQHEFELVPRKAG